MSPEGISSIFHPHSTTMPTFFQLCPSLASISYAFVSLLLFLFSIWIIKLRAIKNENKSNQLPPEARGGWPIIGHFHLFRGALPPHKLLAKMADEHGPIFFIRNGMRKAIVISSWEMAKECLLMNDKSVTSRPSLIVVDIIGYGDANFAFSPYGSYWRNIRRIVTLKLLSNYRLDTLSYVWKEEVNDCVRKMYCFWFKNKRIGSNEALIDLKPWFSQLSMSIIVRIVSGRKFLDCERDVSNLRKTMEEFFCRIGSFLIGDAFPYLRWLDIGGEEKTMKKIGEEMDAIFETWLRDHKQRRKLSNNTKCDKDFMDVMLSILDDSNVLNDSGFDADTINKATCLMMLSGASDTTAVFLTWAISLLLNNQKVLKKAKDELNAHVGKDRQVSESDIPKLVYLQAIVKETLRMYPPAPLSGPRVFTQDCTIAGYHVKKGTRLIVNLSKIHVDPRVYEDAMEFRPERFLDGHKDVDVRGQSFELIPFGSGRRMCPGFSFGLRNIHFLLASFLHAFEFSVPDDAPVDMTESFGLTNMKATPLDVLLVPCLSTDLYE